MFWSGLTVLLAVCATLVSSGSQKFKGPCPEVKSMSDFNINAFNGTWYEIGHHNRGFPGCGDCLTYTFIKTLAGMYIKFEKGGTVVSFGKFINKDKNADFSGNVQYRDYDTEEYKFHIISTDYSCVAVVYTCKAVGDSHISSSYILSKTPNGICYTLKREATEVRKDAQELPDLEFENYERNDQVYCNIKKN